MPCKEKDDVKLMPQYMFSLHSVEKMAIRIQLRQTEQIFIYPKTACTCHKGDCYSMLQLKLCAASS